ncbi:MAG TPA: cytochrome c oxidase subunit 3 [Variovorax sp.]|nr:cytochrome c oxidase subunit 3 [Variovorax sp.]
MASATMSELRLPIRGTHWQSTAWWGMAFLILTEGSLFAYLFFSYFYLASQDSGARPPGGPPELLNASISTVLLLSSSGLAWWAERGIARGSRWQLSIGLVATLVAGSVFIAIQAHEWSTRPFRLSSSPYSSLFFAITGFHGAHVIVGLLMLAALLLWNAMGRFAQGWHLEVSIGIVYWHFVDVVWLAVYATLFLSPRLS